MAYKFLPRSYLVLLAKLIALLLGISFQSLSLAQPGLSVSGSSRATACLESRNCSFKVWGAAAGPAKMSFWVLESEWRSFDASDKKAIKQQLEEYVELMRSNPENYARNSAIGAGIPRSAPAFSLVAKNVANASGWVVFLSPRRSATGGLLQGREINKL